MQIVLSEEPPSAFPEGLAELVWLPRIYITRPEHFRARSVRVVNLSRDCVYLGTGYYASLLAEARGHKVIPSVQTILDLGRRSLYRFALPELNAILAKSLSRLTEPVSEPVSLLIAFGNAEDGRFRGFTRAVFDRFRHPLLRLVIAPARDGCVVKSVEPLSLADLAPGETAWFHRELAAHLKVPWRAKRAQPGPRYSVAMLHDPEEALAPSRQPALDRFVRVGAQMGIEVESIRKQDMHRLAEFDALLIRETTAITNHTYRFARRAEREGLAVIDDPASIVRCTNKVYLAELLAANGVPTPSTVVLDRRHLKAVGAKLTFPLVLKVPDGSFSRGVFKVNDHAELHRRANELLEDSDLILAQEYVPTQFDWRVGVLNRAPLYVCQYFMSKNHWQIVKHEADGRFEEGTFKTYAVEQAPDEVVELALRAAGLIGDGLYGVDIKQTERGPVVIEINDNPNLDVGIEDAVIKDELWRRVLADLVRRIELRRRQISAGGNAALSSRTRCPRRWLPADWRSGRVRVTPPARP
jgi:glutathione synthase/RimK-type ligase-like ATP-grasp enzyme